MSKFKFKNRPPKEHKKRSPEGSKSGKKMKSFFDRKAERRAELGRTTEDRVLLLLRKKYEQGELISFAKHPAYSPEDLTGKDFSVKMLVDGREVVASFGITISNNQTERDIPLIVIPLEMTDERIWFRICRICKEKAEQ